MDDKRSLFELVLATVGGVGTNFNAVNNKLEMELKAAGCEVIRIKLSDLLVLELDDNYLNNADKKINKIDNLRKDEAGVMAFAAITKIFSLRKDKL